MKNDNDNFIEQLKENDLSLEATFIKLKKKIRDLKSTNTIWSFLATVFLALFIFMWFQYHRQLIMRLSLEDQLKEKENIINVYKKIRQ